MDLIDSLASFFSTPDEPKPVKFMGEFKFLKYSTIDVRAVADAQIKENLAVAASNTLHLGAKVDLHLTTVGHPGLLFFTAMIVNVELPVFNINSTNITNDWRLSFRSIASRTEFKAAVLENNASVFLFSTHENIVKVLLELQHVRALQSVLANMGEGSTKEDLRRI